MKITILQRDIVWASPEENVRRADEAISRNPGSEIYVLPEMFSTGFCTNPEGIAESVDSATLQWMKKKSATPITSAQSRKPAVWVSAAG